MDPARYERVRELFEQALGVVPGDREHWLARACAGDGALHAEVSSLLAHADSAAAFLEAGAPGAQVRRHVEDGLPARPLPERVGHYRIVRLLGEGGMGAVYEAEQDSPRRRVALKVLRPGLLSPSLLRRFERESDVLGRLQHPGIAQVHEAGVADLAGQPLPYFAMELVDGEPLDVHAAKSRLTAGKRLDLIARVADAVEHAHARGIVHRDLKPANILVDAAGRPKVLDFGVARALGDVPAATLQTATGQLVGTLPYMSPEQLAGRADDVDARSDVYALGVLAFELLAGRLPHDVARLPLGEAVRVVRDEEPSRLGSLDRSLRGDVETIVGKALEKDRARRYPSAAALASDLRRHLRDEPIAARPPSAMYQLRKFTRRNRGVVAGLAAAFLALLAGTVIATRQAVVAQQARREEVRQRRLAERGFEQARASQAQALAQAYRASLAAAVAALRDEDPAAARQLLAAAPPALRGWEWHHLSARLDQSIGHFDVSALTPPVAQHAGSLELDRDAVVLRLGNAQTGEADVLVLDDGLASVRQRRRLAIDVRRPLLGTEADLPQLARGVRFGPGETEVPVVDPASGRTFATLRTCDPDARSCCPVAGPPAEGSVVWISDEAVAGASDEACRCDLLAGTGECLTLEAHPWMLAERQDGVVAYVDYGATVRVLDLPKRRRLASLPMGVDSASALAWSPAGDSLVLATSNGRIRLWDARDWRVVADHRSPRSSPIHGVVVSPDGSRIAAAGADEVVRVWDSGLERRLATLLGHEGPIGSLVFDTERSRLFSSGSDGVRSWAVDVGPEPSVLRGHESYVYPIAFSPDGTLLASGSWDGTVRTWDARSLLPRDRLPVPADETDPFVYSVVFSPDGRRVHAGVQGGGLLSWDLESRRLVARSHLGSRMRPQAMWPGPGGTLEVRVVTPLWADVVLAVVDASTLEIRAVLPERGRALAGPAAVRDRALAPVLARIVDPKEFGAGTTDLWPPAVALSPRGDLLVVAGVDGSVGFHDPLEGRTLERLAGHRGAIYAAAFSPDGTRCATAGLDGVIRLWDPETATEVFQLRGHQAYVYGLAWSPDGRTLASGSGDTTVRLWSTQPLRDVVRAREGLAR